jgi:hypothetical protein
VDAPSTVFAEQDFITGVGMAVVKPDDPEGTQLMPAPGWSWSRSSKCR